MHSFASFRPLVTTALASLRHAACLFASRRLRLRSLTAPPRLAWSLTSPSARSFPARSFARRPTARNHKARSLGSRCAARILRKLRGFSAAPLTPASLACASFGRLIPERLELALSLRVDTLTLPMATVALLRRFTRLRLTHRRRRRKQPEGMRQCADRQPVRAYRCVVCGSASDSARNYRGETAIRTQQRVKLLRSLHV